MRIAFCTPFKPLDNPRPSGDVTIPTDLIRALRDFGHTVELLPFFSCKQIWQDPERMQAVSVHVRKAVDAVRGADCVLTYGSYYKVPDAIGPRVASRLGVPYFLFQGSYAPSRADNPHTWPGFVLNELAMLSADYVFCNTPDLLDGCAKILEPDDFGPVRPGFDASAFVHDAHAAQELREAWKPGDAVVVGCAAMMRPGVKTDGVKWLIRSVAELRQQGQNVFLVVAGGGDKEEECRTYAGEHLGSGFAFPGAVEREDLAGLFSALDVFAFPGIEESVGMAYLEAQACGVPCVATDHLGAPHVIDHGKTGLISKTDEADFTNALHSLVRDAALRAKLAEQAPILVRDRHDIHAVYGEVNRILMERTR